MQNLELGTPVYSGNTGRVGYICAIGATDAPTFLLVGSRAPGDTMTECNSEFTIVWEDDRISKVPNMLAAPWIKAAADMALPTILNYGELLTRAETKTERGQRERREKQAAADVAREQFRADAATRIPSWAKAALIGELIEDRSDSMSDYSGSTTTRSVILGFSAHTRDLFSEMRQAARNHPDTAFLADADAKAEHREKYSMGAGYYLKSGARDWNGWKVSKLRLNDKDPGRSLPIGEWSLAAAPVAAAPVAAAPVAAAPVAGIEIQEHLHTKKGFMMHICVMPSRVERAEFDRLRDCAKGLGGWYSTPWGKTPGGFAFKDRADANAFVALNGPESAELPTPESSPVIAAATVARLAPVRANAGDRFDTLADDMQSAIDDKFRDRLTNTPKRKRQADEARNDGYQLQRAQKALRTLAEAHRAGSVPDVLRAVTSKKDVLNLMQSKITRNGGYYDAGVDTGEPYHVTPQAVALWAMIGSRSKGEIEAEALRRKVQDLQFANIPGYFPTPAPVVEMMIDHAGIVDGMSVLEPEAGSGAIADAVRETFPNCILSCFEIWESLADVLRLKGHNLCGSDFMDFDAGPRFDRVLMNPPFENGEDMDHVRRAHSMLAPSGRLVAIMSSGAFFRQDRRASDFRMWFESLDGERYDLPAGSFKESGTGVNTVLVVIHARESA